MSPTCVPSARHYARAYEVLDGVGGWITGAQVCTNCVTTAVNTMSQDWTNNGGHGTISIGSDVNCTATSGGAFVSNAPKQYDRETKRTKSINIGHWTNQPTWLKLDSWCTPESTPPDWNPNTFIPGSPNAVANFYRSETYCERLVGLHREQSGPALQSSRL
jgi:hypothetical protein